MSLKTNLFTAVAVLALGVGYADYSYAQMATIEGPVVTAAVEISAANAQTIAVVAAADGFLATLDAAQKKTVSFAFKDAVQRVNWSNFPLGGPGANRLELKCGDMTDIQKEAIKTLLNSMLSLKGAKMALEQVSADDIIATGDAAAATAEGNTSRPYVSFGSEFYFVSFIGAPSVACSRLWTY